MGESDIGFATPLQKSIVSRQLRKVLADGPKSTRELADLGIPLERKMGEELVADGVIKVDPDRFPDDFVPGNPLVVRLPDDKRQWPGWKNWNI